LEGLRPQACADGVVRGPQLVVAIEDIARLRDGVGAAPIGVPAAFTEEVADPLASCWSLCPHPHPVHHRAAAALRPGMR